jgi:hypothetical protein
MAEQWLSFSSQLATNISTGPRPLILVHEPSLHGYYRTELTSDSSAESFTSHLNALMILPLHFGILKWDVMLGSGVDTCRTSTGKAEMEGFFQPRCLRSA